MKKVLIITYYWPPSGGIGVLRCLKFVKYLRNFDWEPIVYTVSNPQYPYIDETNFKDIPENITVLKHKIIEPFTVYRKLSGKKDKKSISNVVFVRAEKQNFIDKFSIWLRGNFFIPDARSMWIGPSVRFLSEYIKNNRIDAILTDGPPHTNTVIGCKLSEKFNIPWLADFQDPWTQVDYYKLFKITKWADKRHRKMEQKVFKIAKKITIASPTWAKDLEKIGAKNVSPIFYAYDEDDFPKEDTEPSDKYTVVHAGLLGFDRFPETFLKVLYDLKNEDNNFGIDLSISFAGEVDFSIVCEIEKLNLKENFILYGNISRPEALKLVLSSHILLLPLNKADNAMGRIPGKLFEYIRARRPILCLGPDGSDVSKIIKETKSGSSFEYDDYEGIKLFMQKHYKLFKENRNLLEESDIFKYDAKYQTSIVASYLDEIIKN